MSAPFSSRKNLEFLLFIADLVAALAAILYATSALRRESRHLDLGLLLVFVATPHLAARVIRHRGWPHDFKESFRAALVLTLTVLVLGAVGALLVFPKQLGPGPTELAIGSMVMVCWASGFLLFVPHTYRLHDALVGGVLLIGAIKGRPSPFPYMAASILGICLSSPLRHQLFDLFPHQPRAAFRATYALAFGLLGVIVAAATFLIGEPVAARLIEGRSVESASKDVARRAENRRKDRPTATNDAPSGRVGYTDQFRLTDISNRVYDDRPAFVVRAALPTTDHELQNRLPAVSHWLVHRYDTPDEVVEGWLGLSADAKPSQGDFVLPEGFGGRPITMDVEILDREISRLPVPQHPRSIRDLRAPDPGASGPGVFRSLQLFEDDFGELSTTPEIDRRTRFRVEVVPMARHVSTRLLNVSVRRRSDDDDPCLSVPSVDQLGFDLVEFARRILGNDMREVPPEVIRRRWEQQVARHFVYDLTPAWTGTVEDFRLREFLLNQRRGDCGYFASATTLLFRAAGIPARLATGFVNLEWVPENSTLLARNRGFHAWTEVESQSGTWVAVDATGWTQTRVARRPMAAAQHWWYRLTAIER
ncbi:MAG: transglutaminase domain-containing protein, partial [Planctomycetes bacterium]|nr:transglutaminase domain-containing protein [Planctomycetota bacterium]